MTYIDSNGKEHIREHLNLQLDFKPVVNDTWNKVFDFAKDNKMPTTRNCRIFEVAKELIKAGRDYSIDEDGYMRVSVYPRGENVEVGIDEALRMLLYHKNTGMCITNMDLNMSLVFIGEADSEDQWWDTLAHEVLDHAKVAILDYYRVPLRSEGSAWLTGYLMRKVVQLIAPPCA